MLGVCYPESFNLLIPVNINWSRMQALFLLLASKFDFTYHTTFWLFRMTKNFEIKLMNLEVIVEGHGL